MSRRDFEHRIRKTIGDALVPVFTLLRRRESKEVADMLESFFRVRAEWHRLSSIDRANGVDYDDESSAGHLAYLAYEQEIRRLREIPLPKHLARWYGWKGSGMTSGCKDFGDMASLAGYLRSQGGCRTLIPLRRREWYAVIGWRYQPEWKPSPAEIAGLRRMSEAMSRAADHHAKVQDVGPFRNVHTLYMGREFFEEVAANLHEIDAEDSAPHPRQQRDNP